MLVLEAWVVDGQQFAEDLRFNLFHKIRKGVSVNEAAFLGVVAVEVAVEAQPVLPDEMPGEGLYCVDGWLFLEIGIDVEAIEVVAEGVHAEVSVVDPVDVNHWHHHKHEHVPQYVGSQVLPVQQKVYDALHGVRGHRLARMHSGAY